MVLKLFLDEQEVPVLDAEEAMSRLAREIGKKVIHAELLDGGQIIRTAGTRNHIYLEYQQKGKETVAFCLSKRKQTLHELNTQKGSVSVPVYQILQKEDILLIVSCLLERKALPDAYHQEKVTSRLG